MAAESVSTDLILKRLDDRMAELNLSANAVSLRAGVERSYFRQLRQAASVDKRSPRVSSLVKLCDALGLRVPWVIEGTGRRLVEDRDPVADLIEVPILSWVAATLFAESASVVEPEGMLYQVGLGRGDFVAFTVKGDSMDRVAPDGAHIVVDRADNALTPRGFFVCATADRAQATFKRWLPNPDRLVPFSTNPEHEPILLPKPPRVVGRLRRVIFDVEQLSMAFPPEGPTLVQGKQSALTA